MKLPLLSLLCRVTTVIQKNAALWAVSLVIVGAAVNGPTVSAQTLSFTGATLSVTFGSANVCPAGHTIPAPCSNSLTLTYNVKAGGTLGTP